MRSDLPWNGSSRGGCMGFCIYCPVSEAGSFPYGIIPVNTLGASGAVYGLMGAMIAWLLLSRRRNDRGLYGRIGFALFLMFYSGTVRENIDQMAHLGGFICGLILCGIYVIVNGSRKVKAGGGR